jgi:uncharacterized repeat protein (TIGR01451 family)
VWAGSVIVVMALVAIVGLVFSLPSASAAEAPSASVFAIQTNGPNGLVTLGDWYTSNAVGAGGGYHYVRFTVPCGWPAGSPVHVDLFSPEMNRVSGALGQSEEPNGAYDSTQFELYGPGAVVGPGFASPAPGTGVPGTRMTFQPGAPGVPEAWMRYSTLAAPVACGNYVVRSEVLTSDPLNPTGTGDDQNSWRIRVGTDTDADPTNAPPAGSDDPDGIPGTNDEITVGVDQASFQQDSGALACQTFYEYVSPGQASITFNNFDMDGNTRIRYYAPSDASYDPTALAGGVAGTLSNNGQWNGGTLATRVGDTIPSPESGWWRVVTCISSQNQFIQEGEAGRAAYYVQPPTPALTIAKSDGVATAAPGQTLTYSIDLDNTASGATAGAANNVVVNDILPAGVTYQACGSPVPAQGTWVCSESGGTVTFTQNGWIDAGANARLTVTVTVAPTATGSIVNNVTADYTDQIGNPFARIAASDTDAISPAADLSIAKNDSPDPVVAGGALAYTVLVTNNGPADATGVTVTDTLPSAATFGAATSTQGSCTHAAGVVTCQLGTVPSGATATITITVTPTTPGTISNVATVSASTPDPTPGNDSDTEETTIGDVGGSADLGVTKAVDEASPREGDRITYAISVSNDGPDDATGVEVTDVLPAGLSFVSAFTSQGVYDGATGSWNVGSLAPGDSAALRIRARVRSGTAGASITNRVNVSGSDQNDPDPGNDADSASVGVEPAGGTDPGGTDPGGGTALTGLPVGPSVFVWMMGMAMLGVSALGLGRATRFQIPIRTGDFAAELDGDAATPRRFLAEPFFFHS